MARETLRLRTRRFGTDEASRNDVRLINSSVSGFVGIKNDIAIFLEALHAQRLICYMMAMEHGLVAHCSISLRYLPSQVLSI